MCDIDLAGAALFVSAAAYGIACLYFEYKNRELAARFGEKENGAAPDAAGEERG